MALPKRRREEYCNINTYFVQHINTRSTLCLPIHHRLDFLLLKSRDLRPRLCIFVCYDTLNTICPVSNDARLTLRIRSSSNGPGRSLCRSRLTVLSSQFDKTENRRGSPTAGGSASDEVGITADSLHKCREIV